MTYWYDRSFSLWLEYPSSASRNIWNKLHKMKSVLEKSCCLPLFWRHWCKLKPLTMQNLMTNTTSLTGNVVFWLACFVKSFFSREYEFNFLLLFCDKLSDRYSFASKWNLKFSTALGVYLFGLVFHFLNCLFLFSFFQFSKVFFCFVLFSEFRICVEILFWDQILGFSFDIEFSRFELHSYFIFASSRFNISISLTF